jgi:hypothetical protein
VLVGSFSHPDHAGTNRVHFTGRLHGQPLTAAHYLLLATATLAGQASRSTTKTFAILGLPPICQDPDNDGDCDALGPV